METLVETTFKSIISLLLILSAAILIWRIILPKLKSKPSGHEIFCVIESLQLNSNQILSIVKVCRKCYLVATSANSATQIYELDFQTSERIQASVNEAETEGAIKEDLNWDTIFSRIRGSERNRL
jgi:flagellar biogenesis protein FliO